jgi:ribonuclease HI
VEALKETLKTYCDGSGQKINLDKSSVFFGNRCDFLIKNRVKNSLEVQSEVLNDKYLGMPTSVGRSSKATFNFLYDMIWKRMNGVTDRPLSRAGNETFLKSVIQAIPTHAMSCFQVPIGNCEQMRAVVANQWWGVEGGKRKQHWRSWKWLSAPKTLGGMGFRDMALFNQAMLGKQGWRLLTEPSSLCARVLKGRYFPHTDFWHAPKPRSSSYTWRSILFGRELLFRGAQWGIGDGRTVKITSDNWIPDRPAYMLRPVKEIPGVATVHCLIDAQSRSWIPETVNAFFDEGTADQIMQVQISKDGADFIRWPHTKNGMYSVRSAYNLARTDSFFVSRSKQGGGSSSSAANEEKQWKMVWKINAPGKMKIHMWRFAHDCLPTGVQLVHRHIPASSACVFCGRSEDVEHAFLQCQFAQEVWRVVKSSFGLQLTRRDFMSPKLWLFQFLQRATELEATVLTVGCWYIWEARNDVRNNQLCPNPKQTGLKIIAYVDMIVQHCFKVKPGNRCESNKAQKWTPPPPGEILVNVDAALFPEQRRSAVGAVFRDNRGECILAFSEPLPGFPSPEMAEALALKRAVVVAKERGLDRVTFASDCLSLIQRIATLSPDRSMVGVVASEIKTLMASFASTSFKHVRRSSNEAAHILARSCDVSSIGFISYSAPASIRKTLCIDVM